MEYRTLGRSSIEVSSMALGVMTFGAQTPEDEAFQQLDLAFASGINFFDTAENYPAPVEPQTQGRSEQILGRWIQSRRVREKVVVATKVTGPGAMEHIRGDHRRLDRKNITAAIEGSLRRLNTEYIDLYQLHWPDRPITTANRQRFVNIPDAPEIVPLKESLEVLGELVTEGKVRQIGVANESPWGVMKAVQLSDARALPRIASIQNGYNLLDRRFELGLAEIAMREQVGLIAYSPLAHGLLTGKYSTTGTGDGTTRKTLFPGLDRQFRKPGLEDAANAYVDLARKNGLSPGSMALAFIRQQPFVTSVLMAASTFEQLRGNIEAIDLELPRELVKDINRIHDTRPNPAW